MSDLSRVSGQGLIRVYLLGDLLVSLVEDSAALRVAEDDPLESNVVQLVDPVNVKSRSR